MTQATAVTGSQHGSWVWLPPLLAAWVLTSPAAAERSELRHAPLESSSVASSSGEADRFTLLSRAETYVQLFHRALLPGPGGAAVTSEAASPLTQYLRVSAHDIDAPWQRDAVDLELSAWAQLWPTSSSFQRPFDGDVQVANVGLRASAITLRLGRQQVVGGAARFTRFDGFQVSLRLPGDLALAGYGGYLVLPRWDARPGYALLGLRERELSRGEQLALERSAHWVTGARLGYEGHTVRARVSFHQQHEAAGLARQNLGLDAQVAPGERWDVGASALYELTERHFADARLWLGYQLFSNLDVSLEALRSKPALLLSRQSVLSVFGSSAYDEAGGALSWGALDYLRLEGSGYLQAYDTGRPGARADAAVRFEIDHFRATSARVGYGRVVVAEQGYQMLRASLARRLLPDLQATLELYGYFYDQPVLGYRSSSVYSGSLSYRALEPLELLWGASFFRSPYAALDAQTLLRVSYDFDLAARRPR